MRATPIRSAEVSLGALLTALALAIPIAFRGWLQFTVPTVGYSATLASHVPSMISIIIGPYVAFGVGLASTLGFLFTLGPIVAARAFTHAIWGLLGAVAYRRGWSLIKALLIVALPIHVLGEPIAVILFGVPPIPAFLWNATGTLIHHLVDVGITVAVVRAANPILAPVIVGGIRIGGVRVRGRKTS